MSRYRRSHPFVSLLVEAGCAAGLIGTAGPPLLPGVVRSVLAAVAAICREAVGVVALVVVAVDVAVCRR